MGKVYNIGLVQINSAFSGAGYFPYSAGLIEAYYRRYGRQAANRHFLPPVFEPGPIADSVRRLLDADMVGFGVYTWNFHSSLAVAASLKKAKPDMVLAFGGPQVFRRGDEFLQKYPFIDLVCHGEGEQAMTDVIDLLPAKDWGQIPAISFRRDGQIVNCSTFDRIIDLNRIPSPYLDGVFDRLMAERPDRQWLGLWETNRGCPFACAFCDWGAPEQKKVYKFSLERSKAELKWFSDHHVAFIFCCDSNFGLYERDIELAAYAADLSLSTGYPQALSVQNAKNSEARLIEIQKELARGGLNKGVTLALQSANPTVLSNIHRKNIGFKSYAFLQKHFTELGIPTYTDLIIGLPGESYDSFLTGVDRIIANGQYNRIQFGNLIILPNAAMAEPTYIEKYGLETVESECINIHGSRTPDGEVREIQQMVVATAALSRRDWVRARAWAWMCSFLFFDKLLQLPLTLISEIKGLPISKLIEDFLDPGPDRPLLAGLAAFLLQEAEKVQSGGPEYFFSADYLGIHWPPDEYFFISLVDQGHMAEFFAESRDLLISRLHLKPGDPFNQMLTQALDLNLALMKTPVKPGGGDLELTASCNLWGFFRGLVTGRQVQLQSGPVRLTVKRRLEWENFDDWMRRVVWYGNKIGAYWWPVEESPQ